MNHLNGMTRKFSTCRASLLRIRSCQRMLVAYGEPLISWAGMLWSSIATCWMILDRHWKMGMVSPSKGAVQGSFCPPEKSGVGTAHRNVSKSFPKCIWLPKGFKHFFLTHPVLKYSLILGTGSQTSVCTEALIQPVP